MSTFSSRLRNLSSGVHVGLALGLILLAIAPLGHLAWRTSQRKRDLERALLRSEAVLRTQWFGARASAALYAGTMTILRPPSLRRLDAPTIAPQDMFDAAEHARLCQCVPYLPPRYVFSTGMRPGSTRIVGADTDSAHAQWLESAIDRTVHDLPEDFDVAILSELDRRTGSVVFISGGKGHTRNPEGAPFIYGFATDTTFVNRNAFGSVGSGTALRSTGDSAGIMRSIAVQVRDEHGAVVFRTGGPIDSTISARLQLGDILGQWVIEASLRPTAAQELLARGLPVSPQRYLAVFLAVSALLLLAAGLLMWRMIEFARLRADFTSSISHELRTPLTQLLLYAETLEMDRAPSVGERHKAVEIITRETRRLLHLVENILRFSRAERTGITLDRTTMPVLPVLEELLATFEPLARARRVEVRLHNHVEPPAAITADEDAFRRVVLNLLDNAVKHGPAGQKVDVTLERQGSWIRVLVEDRGPGVPADSRDRIFQPYERLKRGRGTGIGLAIVRQLVEAHDGRYGVEARADGGARFFVEFLASGGAEA